MSLTPAEQVERHDLLPDYPPIIDYAVLADAYQWRPSEIDHEEALWPGWGRQMMAYVVAKGKANETNLERWKVSQQKDEQARADIAELRERGVLPREDMTDAEVLEWVRT